MDINQLIEPITENNIVNSINIASSQKNTDNFWIDSNFIKGKKYSNNYVDTNNKIGQLKIKKFVNTRLFNTPYSIVSKAVKQKQVISLNTDIDKYIFLKNASREDLKKIRYYNYFGIRYDKEYNKLFDFDRRLIYNNVEKDPEDENDFLIDKEDAEPMLDTFKYRYVFIDPKKFEPVLRYYVKDKEAKEENNPEFINKQQNGVESEIIFPKNNSINEETSRPITIDEEINQDSESITKPDEGVKNLILKEGEEPPSEIESVESPNDEDLKLTMYERASVVDQADNHLNSIVENDNLSEQDKNILGIIFSGDEDTLETINPEDISDNLRKTLKTIKDEKIQSEKEVNKTGKDLRRTLLKYIDKYVDQETAVDFNSDPDRYNITFLVNYFREISSDDFYKVNKRSIDAVQRRIDKFFYYYHMQGYYYDIPIKQLNRLTSTK